MCGIVGCVVQNHSNYLESFLHQGVKSLRHRGPDSKGFWLDSPSGVGFGHTRLSIQDTSSAGDQPMHSSCGRFVITYNGEIYNHLELRKILEGHAHRWTGSSDTETLLACISIWGLEKTLDQIVGMYAFAIWDKLTQQLTIARDRMGEKPLYYGQVGGDFLFASEIHALRNHPAWQGTINRTALAELLRTNYIPSPISIFQGIKKLEQGTFLTFDRLNNSSILQKYWSANEVAEAAYSQGIYNNSDSECLSELEHIFNKVIDGQMLADVPLGAFLSGGIDSTAVVATMQSLSSRPVQTFTIGFNEKSYNEAHYAKTIANHLGTDHTELYVSPCDIMDVIPNLSGLYTEPFADSSQIPTHLISKLARQNVKVALSGDGGDELFGGYNRYLSMNSHWTSIRRTPIAIRKIVSAGLNSVPSSMIDALATFVCSILGPKYQISNASDKVRKISQILTAENSHDFYTQLVTQWNNSEAIVKGINGRHSASSLFANPSITNQVESMMLMDQTTYLPDDILVKVDRAAMGSSLETRTPFLDHRLVEFSWALPFHMKIRNGRGKWLLRELVHKHVPKELTDRPKMGFALPLDLWLRGPLREWAENLLNEQRLEEQGYFNPIPIREKWESHLAGRSNWQNHLWSILMFQSWLDSNQ